MVKINEYSVIIVTVPVGLTQVRLYPETIQHVVEEHPEIPAELPIIAEAVVKALQDPSHVELSYSNSYVFVDRTSTNRAGDALRVPVKVIGNGSARVKTFYFATGSAAANVIWRKDDE